MKSQDIVGTLISWKNDLLYANYSEVFFLYLKRMWKTLIDVVGGELRHLKLYIKYYVVDGYPTLVTCG